VNFRAFSAFLQSIAGPDRSQRLDDPDASRTSYYLIRMSFVFVSDLILDPLGRRSRSPQITKIVVERIKLRLRRVGDFELESNREACIDFVVERSDDLGRRSTLRANAAPGIRPDAQPGHARRAHNYVAN
jgi:hypothetical protein